MSRKKYAILGLLAPIIFWVTYSLMSNLRPEYSLFTKAVSELGSVDASNRWYWNMLGYIIPGLLISIYGYGLYQSISSGQGSKLPLVGLVLSGLMMSLSGVFPGDFDNRQSTTMLWHTIGSFGSYLFFLVAAFTYPAQMRKTRYWEGAIKPTLLLTWLTIIFGAWPFVFTSMPALGQRLVFLFYLLWIGYTAWRLFTSSRESK